MSKSKHKVSGDKATPVISVILPVYNAEKYIAESIDSILAQTFTDFELLIIDDGSTDGSLSILQQYLKRDARIHLISRENRNLVTTLNEMIDIARGRWIARMDADDISLPQRFERQLEWLDNTGADICGSWVKFFGSRDRHVLKHCQTDEAIKLEMLFAAPFAHPTVIMKTSLIKKLMYDKAWEKAEDYDLWERAAREGWKMSNIPEVLLLYRQHGSQISTIASCRQQELTLEIQERYSRFMADSLGATVRDITQVLIMNTPAAKPDMNLVEIVFTKLLHRTNGEARQEILCFAARLYLKVAADCPDIIFRWKRLNQQIGSTVALHAELKLWLIRLFRIRYGTPSFDRLKKLYSLVGSA